MNKVFNRSLLPILLGILIGGASFYPFTYTNPISMSLIGGIKRNQWVTHFDLLGSIRPEVIYLEAMSDDDGVRLSGKNDYVLRGIPPKSRYWSFVIYDYENSRIDPFEETVANSFRSTIKDNGEYEIILTANPEKYSGKQIINHGSNNFTIIMRIYGPDLKYYEDKISIPVGRIKKVSPHG